MCIMSNADGKDHSISHAFMGMCIAYVASSYCNLWKWWSPGSFLPGVAAGASLHPEGNLADSEASHWSDVCNLDPNPFTDWE